MTGQARPPFTFASAMKMTQVSLLRPKRSSCVRTSSGSVVQRTITWLPAYSHLLAPRLRNTGIGSNCPHNSAERTVSSPSPTRMMHGASGLLLGRRHAQTTPPSRCGGVRLQAAPAHVVYLPSGVELAACEHGVLAAPPNERAKLPGRPTRIAGRAETQTAGPVSWSVLFGAAPFSRRLPPLRRQHLRRTTRTVCRRRLRTASGWRPSGCLAYRSPTG